MNYHAYNREERYLCAHLFRLLHYWASPEATGQHLATVLERSGIPPGSAMHQPTGIFFEVALIRDAYFARKPQVDDFMDKLAGVVAQQEELTDWTPFSRLPMVLRDPSQTHPKQIRAKASSEGIELSAEDSRLYGVIQAMFNAKPDLAISLPDCVVAYEAKFTQAFDPEQTQRTQRIAQVWREVLFADLGFVEPPNVFVSTIGPGVFEPDVSWEWLFELAEETLPAEDRTLIALKHAVAMMSGNLAG